MIDDFFAVELEGEVVLSRFVMHFLNSMNSLMMPCTNKSYRQALSIST
ncbi:hypothetical protein OH492_24590 [Vibrio chagasii]|nr:hypothetical protein [Vibrio chagasii]